MIPLFSLSYVLALHLLPITLCLLLPSTLHHSYLHSHHLYVIPLSLFGTFDFERRGDDNFVKKRGISCKASEGGNWHKKRGRNLGGNGLPLAELAYPQPLFNSMNPIPWPHHHVVVNTLPLCRRHWLSSFLSLVQP